MLTHEEVLVDIRSLEKHVYLEQLHQFRNWYSGPDSCGWVVYIWDKDGKSKYLSEEEVVLDPAELDSIVAQYEVTSYDDACAKVVSDYDQFIDGLHRSAEIMWPGVDPAANEYVQKTLKRGR